MFNKIDTIKPLIIGIGAAGARHLDAQLQLTSQVGIYTTNLDLIARLKKQKKIIIFSNLKDAIKWSTLVHVCTPDDTHIELVTLALKQRKIVLCEKAITTNLADAIFLQKLSHQYNTTLIIGHNYRLTPTFIESRKKILEGKLGIITGIEATYFHDRFLYQQRTPTRKNQDFLYIDGSHVIDLVHWITDEKIVSVQAAKGNKKRLSYTCPDTYQIIIKLTSGLIGHIYLDASSPRQHNGANLIISGEKGQLASHNKVDKLFYYKNGQKNPEVIKLSNTRAFTVALEIKIINDYILGKHDSHWPLPNIDEVIPTMRVLDAIEKSLVSEKTIHMQH